ncbi:hypothetical protein M885DRAFT_568418 [Pelagophyceae sp. CCMP2097]|nr:hypothetical protein M885DRAFT_568418 [Pelagophyceae sp. CCMP2097]
MRHLCLLAALLQCGHGLSLSRRALATGLAKGAGVALALDLGASGVFAYDLSSLDTTGVGADRNFVKGAEQQEPQHSAPQGMLDVPPASTNRGRRAAAQVNAASVTEYKPLKGLYPKVAGKIASHGPYAKVHDVYKYLTASEAKLFRAQERSFVALKPGRLFQERINQRQSL